MIQELILLFGPYAIAVCAAIVMIAFVEIVRAKCGEKLTEKQEYLLKDE